MSDRQPMGFATCEPLETRLERAIADITAQRILTEAVVHAICFDVTDISRLRLMNLLDLVHQEMQDTLGHNDMTVCAYREQRDSLKSLLINGALEEQLARTD